MNLIAKGTLAFLLGALRTSTAFHTLAHRSPASARTIPVTAFQNERRHVQSAPLATAPRSRAAARPAAATDDPYASPELDSGALAKYAVAAATELALLGAACGLLDAALAEFDATLPFPAAAALFYAASLKSRACNPLDNRRPERPSPGEEGASPGFRDRVMPAWTPPGVVFPIMWVLIVGPVRAYSGALVVASTGHFLTVPTMAFFLHLTIGDVWNTINNTEKRYGAAVAGVSGVVASAAYAASQYYDVDPLAGQLLGGTCLWLVTAAALIADTWRLNPTASGARAPLYPVRGEAETSFLWFRQNEA